MGWKEKRVRQTQRSFILTGSKELWTRKLWYNLFIQKRIEMAFAGAALSVPTPTTTSIQNG